MANSPSISRGRGGRGYRRRGLRSRGADPAASGRTASGTAPFPPPPRCRRLRRPMLRHPLPDRVRLLRSHRPRSTTNDASPAPPRPPATQRPSSGTRRARREAMRGGIRPSLGFRPRIFPQIFWCEKISVFLGSLLIFWCLRWRRRKRKERREKEERRQGRKEEAARDGTAETTPRLGSARPSGSFF